MCLGFLFSTVVQFDHVFPCQRKLACMHVVARAAPELQDSCGDKVCTWRCHDQHSSNIAVLMQHLYMQPHHTCSHIARAVCEREAALLQQLILCA